MQDAQINITATLLLNLLPTLSHSLTINHHALSVCLSNAYGCFPCQSTGSVVFVSLLILIAALWVCVCFFFRVCAVLCILSGLAVVLVVRRVLIDCCALFVFIVSCDKYCFVHSHGAMCWSAVHDRGIS